MNHPASCKDPEHCTLPSYAAHLIGFGVAAAAQPTRKPHVVREEEKEQQLSADLPAYKRLRRNGVQPRQIDGASSLEQRAEDQFDVELGHIVPKEYKSRVQEGFDTARELGLSA